MSPRTPKTLHFEAAVLQGAPLPWEDSASGGLHRQTPSDRRRDEDISRELQSLVGDIVRESNANSSFDGSSRQTPTIATYPEQEEDEFGIEDWGSDLNDFEVFSPSHDPLEYIEAQDNNSQGDWIYGDISDGENIFPPQPPTLEAENLPSFLSGRARKQVDDGRLQQYLLTANQVPEDQECSICYQPFSPAAVKLPCSINGCRSYFHGNCILPWLMQSASCPLCRCEIKVPTDGNHSNESRNADRSPLVEALSSLLQELEEESRPWARQRAHSPSGGDIADEENYHQHEDRGRPALSSSSSSSSSSSVASASEHIVPPRERGGAHRLESDQGRAGPRSSPPGPSPRPRQGLSNAPSTSVAAAAALLAAREEELAWLRRQRAADERTRARAAQFPPPKRQEPSSLPSRSTSQAKPPAARNDNHARVEAGAAAGSTNAPKRRQNLAAQALLRRGAGDDR